MSQFDLKYRPRVFRDVLGNHGVISLILKRSQNGTLSNQSMMLGGPKGCGKTSIARLIARALRCSSLSYGEPCSECSSCITILNESSDSVQELDAASQGSVDRVRDMVREIDYGTLDGKNQIYIIDEAQRLTTQAQDAFLKSVEDRLFIIILCTTEPHKMKGPLRSRLEEYSISPPSSDEIVSRLFQIAQSEQIQTEPEALKLIARMNECCPRTSILALERMSILGPVTIDSVRSFFRFDSYELIDKILTNLDSSPSSAFAMLDDLSAVESPTWIRDTIVSAIVNGMRIDVGAKSKYPVPIRFFQNRLQGWLVTAKELGVIDRPIIQDIEATLLIGPNYKVVSSPVKETTVIETPKSSIPTQLTPISQPVQPVFSQPRLVPKPIAHISNKSIELDGVKYTSDERLTTLDDKVNTPRMDTSISGKEVPPVELDTAHAPITEKDFIHGLLSRVKSKG